MHTTLKNVELLKHFKIRKLLKLWLPDYGFLVNRNRLEQNLNVFLTVHHELTIH